MTTLQKEIQISGICLMDGRETTVKLVPSSKKGIYIYPENSEKGIKACLDNVISTLHCTVIGDQDRQVRVVEHFMAACAFAGIDSLDVIISSSELPILDGSSAMWLETFDKAGIDSGFEVPPVYINNPEYYVSGNTNIAIIPSDDFKISYLVNFDHPELQRKWFSWNVTDDRKEIIEARTFGYLKDLEKFQQAGFALGAKVDNTIGLTEEGYTIELRSKDEPIKHKILDLIGDLYLTGINPLAIKGHIIAQEAGHRTHVEFAKTLSIYMEKENYV